MVQSAFSCLMLICFGDGAGSVLCRRLSCRMQSLKKFDQRSGLWRTQVLPIGRHISATLNNLANQLIRRQPHCNLVELWSTLTAFSAQGMAVVTLFGLKNQGALVL